MAELIPLQQTGPGQKPKLVPLGGKGGAIMVPEDKLPPRPAPDKFAGQRAGREILIGVGGTLGFAAGGALGGAAGGIGAVPGAAVGGGLGAAAGSLIYDTLEDVAQAIDPTHERLPESQTGVIDRSVSAAQAGAFELGAQAAAPLLMPVKRFITPMLGKVLGVRSDAAKMAVKLAKSHGVELGAVDVGTVVPRLYAKVIGLFPFSGTPLRKFRDTKEAQLMSAVRGVLDEVAPTASLSNEIGIDLTKAAQGAADEFERIAAVHYDKFRSLADQAGPAIPTSELKNEALKWASEFEKGQIVIGDKTLGGGLNEAFETFIKDVVGVPDNITYAQYRLLQKRFESFIAGANPDGFTVKRVVNIKQAMEKDLRAIGSAISEGADTTKALEAKKALEEADQFFSSGILVFQTPTAQKFGRIDKNIFKPGHERLGTLNPDELLRPVFDIESPQALRDLRNLVGEKAFRDASRNWLEKQVNRSLKDITPTGPRGGGIMGQMATIDTEALARNWGISGESKERHAALKEMLEGSGVRVEDLVELTQAIKIAQIADPNAFVTRRMTLGGLAALSAVGGLGGGAVSAGVTPMGAVAISLLSRKLSEIMANPARLKALTRSFSPNLDDIQRRALLIRALGQPKPEQAESK